MSRVLTCTTTAPATGSRSTPSWRTAPAKWSGSRSKHHQPPGSDEFRGLRHLQDRLGDDFIAGVVLRTGQQTLPFGPKLRAMPISALWELEP
jgi:hypothetical protein